MIWKKHFKVFLVIIFLIIGVFFVGLGLYGRNKIVVKECADKELIKKILENLHEEKQGINVKKVFYYDLPGTKEFLCGYLIESQRDKIINKFVVFSDKQVNFVFIGDIIDIKKRKIVGYDELMQDCFVEKANGTSRD